MEIKDMNKNFSVEALLDPAKVQQLKSQFEIDYHPMWHFLDNLERKTQGFKVGPNGKEMTTGQIFEAIYEYAVISVSLDKADMQTRIDNLNEQNLKWFTAADNLQAENILLKQRIIELEKKS
jgi:hypothetical protein